MLNVPFTALTHNLCFSAQPPERPDTGCLCSAQRGEKTLLEMRVGLLWLIALYPVTEGTKGFLQVSRYMSGFSRQPSLLSTFLLPRNLQATELQRLVDFASDVPRSCLSVYQHSL